ncbi:hypothetical protein Ga0123462_1250 [Mariprofundus ferrinatatus]|uniref:Uncharacterized protein n=1 Tax=Mariprofundus ferrinatatus TaxID=1921087 RepID=A0A2K8LB00_9PROT|nr:hypothetical protein [Mariprofundus ferrinatatus]ATX82114.1 hypothetical protein Ga0123462_1250 [Mariprofundus ferrinatatus]
MKRMTTRLSLFTLTLLFLASLTFPVTASATGPRVTTTLFTVDKDEIHTVDFPPLYLQRGG